MIGVLVVGRTDAKNMENLVLTSRAFGASAITFMAADAKLKSRTTNYCSKVNERWGGGFTVGFCSNWRRFIAQKKNYKTVYLTMFGVNLRKLDQTIRTYKNLIIIVSLHEYAKEIYKAADFNISISSQPHTMLSAIAVFLNSYYRGRELALHFENAAYKIIPNSILGGP